MKPIIFNTEMVKAILDGRKIQFREILKSSKIIYIDEEINGEVIGSCQYFGSIEIFAWLRKGGKEYDLTSFSKYKVDDILYVKETFQTCECGFCEICQVLDGIVFKADYNNKGEHPDLYSCHEDETYWKPSIHLKQKDARLFLKVTNVRVERLQDITVQDIIREGYYNFDCTNHSKPHYFADMAKKWWEQLWNSTLNFHNGIRKSQNILNKYNWEDNPYVFVYEFERI